MYRKILLWLVLFIFIIPTVTVGAPPDNYEPRVGEVLTYKVIVKSVIHGADQVIKVVSNGSYKNHEVVNVKVSMNTVGMVKGITNYSEVEEMVLDKAGLFPWYFRREVTEADQTDIEEVTFDYQQGIAFRTVMKDNKPKKQSEIKLPGYVQDGLSLPFYLRKGNLKPGQHQLYFYSNGKIDPVVFQLKESNQPLKLECGTYPQSYHISNEQSKITIIVSKNEPRLPLIIQKMAQFGKVEARLINVN